jgi:polar amino acid transport system substrate-binding protein
MPSFMSLKSLRTGVSVLLAFMAFALPLDSRAACTRVIQAPVAAIGYSIIIRDDVVTGIYADLLREVEKDGCQFKFSSVPRARLELMFKAGTADLLLPSTRTPQRDELGLLIPLIKSRATVVSISSDRPTITSAQDILLRKDLHLVLVRGFDFGPAYRSLVAEMTQQGRVMLETDVVSVARMLKVSNNYISIMAPSIIVGAIKDDARVQDLQEKFRFEPINELPWDDAGIYISNTSLDKADREYIQAALTRAAKSGVAWQSFKRYYSADLVKVSIRPPDFGR